MIDSINIILGLNDPQFFFISYFIAGFLLLFMFSEILFLFRSLFKHRRFKL